MSIQDAVKSTSYLKCGKLRQAHKFFFQVQGQMALTGLEWCDFIVDNGTDCVVEKIDFSWNLWVDKRVSSLLDFYARYKASQHVTDASSIQ